MSAIDIAVTGLVLNGLAWPALLAAGKLHAGHSCGRTAPTAEVPEPATVPLALPAVNGQADEMPRVVDPSAKPQARNQFGHFVPRTRESAG